MSYLHLVCLLFFHLWRSCPVHSEPIPLALVPQLHDKLYPGATAHHEGPHGVTNIVTNEEAHDNPNRLHGSSRDDPSSLLSLAGLTPAEKTLGAATTPHFKSYSKGGLGKAPLRTTRIKRTPTGFSARGFHEEVFDRDFGHFSPVKRSMKRRPEADAAGFYGDTFSGGFGEFETMKRDRIPAGLAQTIHAALKRRPMGAQGFHGDTFNQGFGDFDTMKRAYGHLYDEMEKLKRRPEMTKSGFDADLFNGGFGEFHPMKK